MTPSSSFEAQLRYPGSDKGMICLDKLRQAYVFAALNTREAFSKQNKDEQVFGRKGKYIDDPHILKEVLVIDAFLQANFLNVRITHK